MDFKHLFLKALLSDVTLTKSIHIQDYLPSHHMVPDSIKEHLPYVQAFSAINALYPYYYELSHFDSFCLLYTESGSGKLTVNTGVYPLTANSICFIDCHEKHRIEIQQSPWNYKVFYLKGDSIAFLYYTYMQEYQNLHLLPAGSNITAMLSQLYTQLSRNPDMHILHAKLISDILFELILEKKQLASSAFQIPDYLLKIKQEFDSNYQKETSLDLLEQQYHISKYRICHEFTEQYHISPIQYLNRKRILAAKEALLYTDRRINEIGRMVGFENTNHFIRLFKQQIGVTPLTFRKHPPSSTPFPH